MGLPAETGLDSMATILKSALPAPQTGQCQSSGTSSQRVPKGMPSSGHPLASS